MFTLGGAQSQNSCRLWNNIERTRNHWSWGCRHGGGGHEPLSKATESE